MTQYWLFIEHSPGFVSDLGYKFQTLEYIAAL